MITIMMLETNFLTMESRVTRKRISPKWTFSELAEIAVKDPETDDCVLAKLIPNNSTKGAHYVGAITEVSTDEGETSYDVEFYRQSRKMNGRFIKPDIEDKFRIARCDIIMCLPKPITTDSTKRIASMLLFNVDL